MQSSYVFDVFLSYMAVKYDKKRFENSASLLYIYFSQHLRTTGGFEKNRYGQFTHSFWTCYLEVLLSMFIIKLLSLLLGIAQI